MSFRRILIAVDGEPVAVRAAETGVDLARSLRAEVALIHVIDTSVSYGSETGIPHAEFVARAEGEGKRVLDGFRQRLSLPPSTLDFLQSGAPAEEIVRTAREWSADLIVIGSHGRGGIQRALVGSVAEGVMRHASCPVLVVRAKD